ncbi:hypothetical protein FSHL1_006448 [Fusarium sambucinum]
MTDLESDRKRTEPKYDSSEDEEPREYGRRSHVQQYADKPDWARPPLYGVNEVVYVAVRGQSQPAGPYIITSTNFENKTYGLKRQDTGQTHPTAVAERDLLVLV